jgi:diaminopropionate ammonia-lyase
MAELAANPFFVPRITQRNGQEIREFHGGIPGYAPTPLHACPALAKWLGLGLVLVKDESHRFGLGAFKALGASWALEQIRVAGGAPRTVSAATEGNHGRAVAWAARRLGLSAVIFLPRSTAEARIQNIRKEGARVELVDGSYDDAVKVCARQSAEAGWQVVSDTGYGDYLTIPGWIAEGYGTLFQECTEQAAAGGHPEPGVVLVQAGVGSLLHGAVHYYREREPQPRIVSVEPVESDALFRSITSPGGAPAPSRGSQESVMALLNSREVSRAAWPAVRLGVNLFLTIEDRYAEAAVRKLARPEGSDPKITAGASGAAGLAGLMAICTDPALGAGRGMLELGPDSTVLVINTEGANDPVAYEKVLER